MTKATQAVQSASQAVPASDIRDIRPPVEIVSPWAWVWWALLVLAVAAAAIFLWRWWRQKKVVEAIVPPVPAHVRAKQRLAEALALIGQPKEFCIAVSDTLRLYLEERFSFHAPERTTEEFLLDLKKTDLLMRDQKDSLEDFLTRCDLVKFAKYEPREPELRDLHASALRLVEETEPVVTPEAATPKSETPEALASQQALADNISDVSRESSSKGKTLAVLGVFLQLAPIIWLIAYVLTIFRLLRMATGTAHSVNLNRPFDVWHTAMTEINSIFGGTLLLVLAGVVVGIAGLVLLAIALTRLYYRAEWFFWFLFVYGVVLLVAFPLGTPIGIFFIVYCLTKRREFFGRQPQSA